MYSGSDAVYFTVLSEVLFAVQRILSVYCIKEDAMKLAVVGTGKIAHQVVSYLVEWGYEFAAIVSTPRSFAQATDLAQLTKSTAFSSFEDALSGADFDTVYLTTPNNTHFSLAKTALEAGKNVIVEKPIASNFDEASELVRIARERKLFLFEATTTLYQPNYQAVKEALPKLGKIRLVSSNYSQYSSRYEAFCAGQNPRAFTLEASGGSLMDIGLYAVTWIAGLFGAPKRVHRFANIQRGIDTSGITTLDYGDFQAVAIDAKDCDGPNRSVIEGEKGYLVQHTAPGVCGRVTLHLRGRETEEIDMNPDNHYQAEFEIFARMIDLGDLAYCSHQLETSLAVSRVLTEARLDSGIRFSVDA